MPYVVKNTGSTLRNLLQRIIIYVNERQLGLVRESGVVSEVGLKFKMVCMRDSSGPAGGKYFQI